MNFLCIIHELFTLSYRFVVYLWYIMFNWKR